MATDNIATDPEIQVDRGPLQEATTPEPKLPESSAPEATPNLLSIDRTKLHTELQRLERDDKEFANALNTLVGRKAARTYQPKIEELQSANVTLNLALRRQQIAAMSEEEVEQRFASDPQFAREYTEIVHSSPEDLDASARVAQVRVALEEIFDTGYTNGIPPERLEEYRKAVANGYYDRDESGQPMSQVASLARIQRDIVNEVMIRNKPAIQSAPPEPQPKVNQALLNGGPDTSISGVKPNTSPDLSDYRRVLDSGQPINADEVDRLVRAKFNLR